MSPPPPMGRIGGGAGGNFRSSIGPRGAMQPGAIEKARDPRHALRRLLPYLTPFRSSLLIVSVLVVIYTVLGLLSPWLMGVAIDGAITEHDLPGLTRLGVIMLIVAVLNNLFQIVAGWIMSSVSQRALKAMRRDLFGHIQNLPLRFFNHNPAGELMSRLTNDIDAINQAVSQNVVALLASVLTLVGILVAMFVLDIWLALASVLVVPIMVVFTEFIARYTRKGFRELQKGLGELNGVAEEAIGGQRVVKAFRRNDAVIAEFKRHNDSVFRASLYANNYALLLMPLTNVLGNLFVIVLAGLGGWLALHDLVTVGIIATFITYGRNFIGPLRSLANMYNSIQSALAGAERVFEIIDSPAEVDAATDAARAADALSTLDAPPHNGHATTALNGRDSAPAAVDASRAVLQPVRGHVRFDHVAFSYEPGTPVIADMTLDAPAGRTIALVGPTGAGKTTIINLLTRFYEIDAGTITIDGIDLRDFPKPHLRRQLGLVLQDTFLFADTVLENIRYGRLDATDEECIAAARLADADHFIHLLPQSYHTILSERAGNLSQGQRQLLAIARAILADPRILILDEATSSVDTRTEARIQAALLRLMQNRTSFVIAHRLSTIRDADQVLVIDRGAIVEQGSHPSLLAQRGVYYHLYVSQFKGQDI